MWRDDIDFEKDCYEYSVHFTHCTHSYIEGGLSMDKLLSIINDKDNEIISIENHPTGFHKIIKKE